MAVHPQAQVVLDTMAAAGISLDAFDNMTAPARDDGGDAHRDRAGTGGGRQRLPYGPRPRRRHPRARLYARRHEPAGARLVPRWRLGHR